MLHGEFDSSPHALFHVECDFKGLICKWCAYKPEYSLAHRISFSRICKFNIDSMLNFVNEAPRQSEDQPSANKNGKITPRAQLTELVLFCECR